MLALARSSLAAALLCAAISPAVADSVPPDAVKIVEGAVATSLTGTPGDPAEGRKAFANSRQGNCLACHANQDMSEQLFHGEVGPPLDGVGSRYKPEELRAILVDSKAVFGPDTVMPGFYSLKVGKNVAKTFVGKTVLSAEQVEGIVAYLSALKQPAN